MKPATSRRLCIVRALLASMSSALTGCVTVGPDFEQPDATIENQWLESLPQQAQAASAAEAAWWTAFNNPVLSSLEQWAYERNLSLQATGLHIFKARAQLAISDENLLPQSGSVSVSVSHINTSGVGPISPAHLWAEHLRVTAGWELDFWGKYRRQIESDRAQLRVSEAAYNNALVSLFADVANAYIDLRALDQRIVVAQQNLKAVQQSRTLTQARFRRGASSQLDVEQGATLVAETEAQIPSLIKARAQDRDTLAVLLADPAETVEAQLEGGRAIPVPPTQIDVGIPADMLRRRPDVRQAALNAGAQLALIGAAKAKLYRSLSLTGLFGLSSGEQHGIGLTQWGSKTIGLFSAGVTVPIFDRGQLKNAVRVQDATFQEAVLGNAPAQVPALPQVSVTRPVPREVRDQIDLSGTVAPSATVTLVARVQGVLKAIGFADGAYVKQGQVLFRIEPDTYRAQLTYDQAALDNAEQELTRQKQLTLDNATSESSLQKAQTTRDQAVAKRDMSRINLAYTEIRAPFAGLIGARAFDVGNLVGGSDSTKLATLDRIQPVYVSFTLNERDANRVGLFTQPPRMVRVNVLGAPAGQGEDAALEFVGTRVDSSSGALRLRADIVNPDAHLIPGMSVEVCIPAGALHKVLLVPDSALLRDQAGASVLIVKAAGVIEKRPIATGGLFDSLREVTAGLSASDQVVTGGALAMAPGAKVQVVASLARGQS